MRANLSEFADQVKEGAEKIITKNGESDFAAGRTKDARAVLSRIQAMWLAD